ncbi:MAG: V-type ATP synthase subunit F [Desulfuromonadales bacterium]|nr:V-type ATP synthase subunit F [Desulfuromonadales bacterium]
MKGVVFITPEDARHGFSLAGTAQLTVNAEQAEELLRRTLDDTDVGVVVIDERLVRAIDAKHYRDLEQSWRGLLVTLPAPQRDAAADDYLQRLIKRALGYHVRLEL